MGGLLIGLPLTTGPIFLVMAIDQGPRFATGAAVGVLFGLIGLAAFAAAYVAASLVAAAMAFFISSAGVGQLENNVVIAGLAAWLALGIAAALIPRPWLEWAWAMSPWWNLGSRILAVAALVLVVITVADVVGR